MILRARLFAAFLLCCAFWGCSKDQKHVGIVNDEAKLFAVQAPPASKTKEAHAKRAPKVASNPAPLLEEIQKRVRDLAQTKDVDVVVRTAAAPNISALALPDYFDKIFENDPAWKGMKAGWFSSFLQKLHLGTSAPSDSVEFIVLANPKFVTLRFGDTARMRAISTGLVSSPELLSIQQHATTDPLSAISELLELFKNHYPPPGKESWRERTSRWLFYEDIDRIIRSITLNNWEFYNRYLLAPTLYLQAKVSQYLPIWTAPLVGVCVVLAFAGALKLMLRSGLGRKGFWGWSSLILVIAIEALAVAPSVGSLLLVSHQRLEDRLFVEALLSPELTKASPLLTSSTANFVGHTGVLWAVGLALVVALKVASEGAVWLPLAELSQEKQRALLASWSGAKQFAVQMVAASFADESAFNEEQPFSSVLEAAFMALIFRPIKYFVLFLYLPFAASIVLCNHMLVGIIFHLRSNWRSYRSYKEIAESNELEALKVRKAASP